MCNVINLQIVNAIFWQHAFEAQGHTAAYGAVGTDLKHS